MRTAKKKTTLTAIALALILSVSVGLTYAYFSDYQSVKGSGTVALGGTTEIHDKYDKAKKTVSIENTGETEVVVRVAVYGPVGRDANGNPIETIVDLGSNWQKVGEGDNAYYYYTKVLKPGDTTTDLVAHTEFLTNEDLGSEANVVVIHESSQVAYDADGNILTPAGWSNAVTFEL